MSTLKITDESFEADVLKSDKPVLVDFWAEWCGPCKQIGPVLNSISAKMHDKLKIVKINIDDSPLTPQKLGVRGVPTLMLFKDGKHIATKVGALPESALTDWINS